ASIAKLINTNQSAALSLGKMINDQIMANVPHKELEKITSQIASIGFNKYLESNNNEMLKTINMVSNQMANISNKTKDLQVESDGEAE
ncbi:MAG: hypothetical protein Q4B43_10240, partial [Bacteroidota bacterium]|nr:hypothetical protein [Bacteroidota bacterium]